ncbi:hypothetical protein ACFV23_40990 [Streptomyces sp. NPDC059627]
MTTAEHPSTAGLQSPPRPALGELRRARARFLAGHPLPADVPDEVAAAWRRARFHGVRPDCAAPLADRAPQAPDPALLAAARPVLERLGPGRDPQRAPPPRHGRGALTRATTPPPRGGAPPGPPPRSRRCR